MQQPSGRQPDLAMFSSILLEIYRLARMHKARHWRALLRHRFKPGVAALLQLSGGLRHAAALLRCCIRQIALRCRSLWLL
jgi:hypothetical protein